MRKPTVTDTHAEYFALSAHVDVIKKRTQRRHGRRTLRWRMRLSSIATSSPLTSLSCSNQNDSINWPLYQSVVSAPIQFVKQFKSAMERIDTRRSKHTNRRKHHRWKTKHSSKRVVWNECAATASLELAYAVWQVVQCLQNRRSNLPNL